MKEKLLKLTSMLKNHEQNFTLLICFCIFSLSVFLRSTIDIGSDTGFYIDYGKKVFEGQKYYYDFFESNFPLSFYLYAFFHKISLLTKINTIIISEIFVNLSALISIFYANKILNKSEFFKENKVYKNLIIISFFLAFFLRISALSIGEFGTKTTLLLILLFVYIAFSLCERKLTKSELLLQGCLMGLIACIKPHYIIFVIFIETYRFFQMKSFKFFVEIDKLTAVAILLLYFNFMLKYTPEFLEFMVPMWSELYSSYAKIDNFIYNLAKISANDISILLLISPLFLYKKTNYQDRILLLFFAASSTLLLVENLATIDQKAIFYGISTICLLKFSYDFFTSKYFNFNENKFIILSLIIIPIFDSQNFFKVIFSLLNIWWLIIFSCLIYLLKSRFIKLKEFFCYIVLLIIFAAISIFSLRNLNQNYQSLINIISFLIFLIIFEINYKKNLHKFSVLFTATYIAVASYYGYLYFNSVRQVIEKDGDFISPNALSDGMASAVKTYAKNEKESYVVISNWIANAYPSYIYLQKINYLKYAVAFIYDPPALDNKEIGSLFSLKNVDRLFVFDYLFEDLKRQVDNKNIKIIFVNNSVDFLIMKDRCHINLLEYYLRDKIFRAKFVKNFAFKNRILTFKEKEKSIKIKRDKFDKIPQSKQKLLYDFEIYVRK